MSRVERLYFSVLSEQNKGLIFTVLRSILYFFSKVFQKIVQMRTWCYRKNYFSSYRPRAFTISIGNITCGGTGKTPLTIALAKEFSSEFQTTILMRGYRSEIEKKKSIKFIQNEKACPRTDGDEACLYARNVPKARIAVGPKRKKAASLIDLPQSAVLLLDDGMQHHGILRDVEIVVVDAKKPFGNRHLLPRGTLREPLSALSRADIVVITKAESKIEYEDAVLKVKHFTRASCFWAKTRALHWRDQNDEIYEMPSNAKVGLFCGIGNPAGFFDFVQKQGHILVQTKSAQDHRGLSYDEVLEFYKSAKEKDADLLICTEKDIVRFERKFPFPVLWPEIQFEIEQKEEFQNLLSIWKKQATTRLARCHEFSLA